MDNSFSKTCFAVKFTALNNRVSSGGVFSKLAEYIISQNGYVCGAAFNDKWDVEHIIINKFEEIQRLSGSKYVQSSLGNSYKNIKELLETGSKVLFSGTPCQVAGLYSFLQNKEYENLYTVDIVCHGTPEQKVWRKYIDEIPESEEVINDVNFRYKSGDSKLKDSLFKLETNKRCIVQTHTINPYMTAFLGNLSTSKRCAECKYANVNRAGDITLGDFWGLEKFNENLNPYSGISEVIINNEKGSSLFSEIISAANLCEKVPIEYAIDGNQTFKKPYESNRNRELFFRLLNRIPFEKNVKVCTQGKYDAAIINLWYTHNYGAVLTAFALQSCIEALGCSCAVINNVPPQFLKNQSEFYQGFQEKWLNLTDLVITDDDYDALNNIADVFISGSDQVLRPDFFNDDVVGRTYLDFVHPNKQKAVFSGSFGLAYINCTQFIKDKLKHLINQTDFVSTREESGAKLCMSEFNREAVRTLDPVFLVDKSKYYEIADDSTKEYKGKIAAYILDRYDDYIQLTENISQKLGKEVCFIEPYKDSPADFIKAFTQADFIITDSYHGVCFSHIFNKPFVALMTNPTRGYSRFKDVLELCDTVKYLYTDVQKCIESFNNYTPPNYQIINTIIQKEREKCLLYLKNILEFNTENFSMDIVADMQEQIRDLRKENAQLKNYLQTVNEEKCALKNQLETYIPYVKIIKILFGKYTI